MNPCKLTLVVMACALAPALNAQMASDKMMNDTKSSSGKMMSDNMMNVAPPKVGEKASDFTLKTLDGQSVRLNDLTAKSDVVLVELRGWPGYQCPLCTIQVHDFVRNAEKIKATGVQVVMVYPGPADDLKAHATEFLLDKSWPEEYLFVLDPDYSVTKAYGLRWDAPGEKKLIPLTILSALEQKSLPVYGDGKNVRDWLYVDDHARALGLIVQRGRPGETYNIGGRNERRNIEVVQQICGILDELRPQGAPHERLITYVADRPGHDLRYAIDATKLETELGWRAQETFETGIEKTVRWYLDNREWWQPLREHRYHGERLGLIPA